MSKEFELGLRIGRGSLVVTLDALEEALGSWAKILPLLEECGIAAELELVASINYILGKEFKLTPPLAARIADCLMRSRNKLLISDAEFMLMLGGGHGERKEGEEQR